MRCRVCSNSARIIGLNHYTCMCTVTYALLCWIYTCVWFVHLLSLRHVSEMNYFCRNIRVGHLVLCNINLKFYRVEIREKNRTRTACVCKYIGINGVFYFHYMNWNPENKDFEITHPFLRLTQKFSRFNFWLSVLYKL
jgi:hypothetical protein